MEPAGEHKRKWNAVILVILILLAGTGLFYFLFDLPVKPAKTFIVTDSIPLTSDSNNAVTEHPDTIPPDTFISPPVVTETKNDSGNTAGTPQKKVTEKGTLRLQSVQGFWFTYEGEIENGKANGKGMALYENGNRYEGHFTDNQRTGYGIAITKAGEKYEGQWQNDRFNGKGKYTWKNGDYYIGIFEEAKRHGKGKLYNAQGKLLQDGLWENDKFVR